MTPMLFQVNALVGLVNEFVVVLEPVVRCVEGVGLVVGADRPVKLLGCQDHLSLSEATVPGVSLDRVRRNDDERDLGAVKLVLDDAR